MSDYWEWLRERGYIREDVYEAWEALNEVASFRPILYIGLGGFGCTVIRSLKKKTKEIIPDERVREIFAFLGLDTHPYDRNDILTANEYLSLSIGIYPNDAARNSDYYKYLGWYKDLAGKWVARSIQSGANKVRAVGRLAFLFPYTINLYYSMLNNSLNNIMTFKDSASPDAPPKVYIVSSLSGGTGAGLFLDLIFITTQHLRKQYGADYRVQVILATPETLEGIAKKIDIPDFYANTYASLKEMFHFICGGEEVVSYNVPGFDKFRANGESIPKTIYLITGRGENGKIIVDSFDELGQLTANFLLSEIMTPLSEKLGAQPKYHEAENQHFDDFGLNRMPRVFSSFGVVRFGLPYEEVEEVLALFLVRKAIADELTESIKPGFAGNWVNNNGLAEAGSDQLQESIRRDKEGREIEIQLDIEGDLSDVKRTDMDKVCRELKTKYESSVKDQYLPLLEEKSKQILENAKRNLERDFNKIMKEESLGTALAFLTDLFETLKLHRESLSLELKDGVGKLHLQNTKVNEAIKAVVAAAKSGFIGRKGRIRSAVGALGGEMEAYINQQIVVWSQELGKRIYDELISLCGDMMLRWGKVRDALKSRLGFVENKLRNLVLEIDKMADINRRGPGNRFSIVDSQRLVEIYEEYIGRDGERNITSLTRQSWKQDGLIMDQTSSDGLWVENIQDKIRSHVINRIEDLNLITIMNKYYPGDKREKLLKSVVSLGSPLFPLNPNLRETNYSGDYIVACHPDIRGEFIDMLEKHLPTQFGVGEAFYGSKYEVVIYSIIRGYTAHSLTRLDTYKSHYDLIQEKYERARKEGRPHRPVHAWIGAEDWEEPIPRPPGEEETYKWFIVGRAFSYLFPTAVTSEGKPDERKNQAFIFNRGNNYYLILKDNEKPIKIGNSLENAVDNFERNPEWQDRIRKLVEAKIDEKGKDFIRDHIEKEYIPIIQDIIEKAKRSRDYQREKLIRELFKAFKNFIEENLEKPTA